MTKQKMYIQVHAKTVVEASATPFVAYNYTLFTHPDCDVLVMGYDPKRHEQIAHLIMCALQARNLPVSRLRYNPPQRATKARKASDKQKPLF